MVTIRIGSSERDLNSANESWINQQINRRKDDGQTACVQVSIREGTLNITLSTNSCQRGAPGRPARGDEIRIFDLWKKRGLYEDDFTGGNVIAFLKQLRI